MSEHVQNQYHPDYVSPPGETLSEVLQERGMSQAELARRTGRPKKTINEIIKGKSAITPETALQLERALGIPARFWNNRQQQYEEHQAALQEEEHLRSHLDWLQRFSVKAMINLGWIQKAPDELGQLRELLNFLGIASPEQWDDLLQTKAVFRKTEAYESDPADVTAWLRRGEIEAQKIYCRPYDAVRFKKTLIEDIRPLTVQSPEQFVPELVRLCADSGVAVVFVPQLPKARVSGATRWLVPDKALIQLSLRYKTDDHLWFSFFHEAGHILLHGKRDFFLENDEDERTEKEQEADKFAADVLIPPEELQTFLDSWTLGRYPSTVAVREFADRIRIAPGIVVGRLQHDGHVPHSHYNKLRRSLEWAHETE